MNFSIRDLLLVTVIVALVLGWWIDHRRQAAETLDIREEFDPLYWQPKIPLPPPDPELTKKGIFVR